MKKLVMCLTVLSLAPTLANASTTDKYGFPDGPMTVEGQRKKYLAYVGRVLQEEKAAKLESKEAARCQQEKRQELKKQRKEAALCQQAEKQAALFEQEQAGLSTQKEYMGVKIQEYMQAFMPMLPKLNLGERPPIPDVVKPRSIYYLPHKGGVIEMDLKGYSTICQSHVVDFLQEFFMSFQGDSELCCKIHESIYGQSQLDIIQRTMINRFNELVEVYNDKAAKNQKLRELFKFQMGDSYRSAGGIFFAKCNPYEHKDFGEKVISSALALQSFPNTPVLTNEDIQNCLQMIQGSRFVKVKLTEPRYFGIANFQGIQY